ncbi:MAG: hypothetical protein JXB10_01435 [Pirellulales bacterium]|nr:hypothetical protein [Pirellulales bacterium]
MNHPQTVQALEREARRFFQDGGSWSKFWDANEKVIQDLTRGNRKSFKTLFDRLFSIVVSGDSDGIHPAGDDEPTLLPPDDEPSSHDTKTAARCLWTPEKEYK